MVGGTLLLAACGSATTPVQQRSATPTQQPSASTSTSATSTVAPSPCDVPQQGTPPASISANFPTALAFAPDGRLFFTERSGAVKVWQGGAVRTFATVATVTTQPGGAYSERGLLGLALSPTFARDHYVYAFYSEADYAHQHVIRWTDCAGVASHPTILITLPSGGDCCHKGGRLAFGPDGKLYVTLGDEHDAPTAQNTADVRGKILRYNADGSVPQDNPFGASNPVWAYGLRNPFGIAFSSSGQLAVTANGPSGDAGSPATGYDILMENVTRGSAHQWPLCYGYSHALEAAGCGGQTAPDWSSERATYVPTGMTFVDASAPAPYASHLVFCTLNYGMQIVTPGSPHASVRQGPTDCRLDVKEGPDHDLYIASLTAIVRIT